MSTRRRELLRGIGAGAAVGLSGRSATGTTRAITAETGAETERVFVHPQGGVVSEVLDAVGSVGGAVLYEYDNFPFVLAEIPSDARDELRSDLRVALIESDGGVGVPGGWEPSVLDLLDPGDSTDCAGHPDQRASWGYERIGAEAPDVDGSDVDVGILDTGIDTDHCDLQVTGGRNFTDSVSPNDYEDRHGHGTHVAGVVGALDNELGAVGVAPNANLYAVKVLGDDGSGSYGSLVAGIDWCISNDVELISMSLGGDSDSDTVDQAIEEAHAAGHLLLCAAGNEGNEGDGSCAAKTMTYPATHEDVIAVTAMDEDDTLASYSSVGEAAELLAPGTRITSTYVDNEYARASGTSVACPFVTGVAACCWETREGSGPGPNETVRATLAESAETVLGTCAEGNGLVDASAAVDADGETSDGEKDGDTDDEGDETDDGADGDGAGGSDGGSGSDDSGTTNPDESGDSNGETSDAGRTPSMFERAAQLIASLLRDVRTVL